MMIPHNPHKIKVGVAQDGSSKMQGEMGRVSIYIKAMTAGEIAALAATRNPISSGGPACVYSGMPAIGSTLPINGKKAYELTELPLHTLY
jgi:hypothetical protein